MASPTGPSSPRRTQQSPRQTPPRLTNLPRFHPANFANYVNSTSTSATSSSTTSPDSSATSPTNPLSPRTARQTPQLSEAQRQLYNYHRELYSLNRSGSEANSPSTTTFITSRPASPFLQPLASPGAVTPLELEEADQADEYLMAGFRSKQSSSTSLNEAAKDQIFDTYMKREQRSKSGRSATRTLQ